MPFTLAQEYPPSDPCMEGETHAGGDVCLIPPTTIEREEKELPVTGASTEYALGSAILALAVGVTLVVLARRRR